MDDRSPDNARTETDEQEEARMRLALSMMRGAPEDGTGHKAGRNAAPGGAPRSTPGNGARGGPPGTNFGGGSGRRPVSPPTDRHAPGARRHRFVQDGEVPVVTVQRPRREGPDPFAAPPSQPTNHAELAAERSARHDLERRLQDTQQALRSFQTRLGDAELARDRAETDLRELRVAHQALQAERAARDLAHPTTASAGTDLFGDGSAGRARPFSAGAPRPSGTAPVPAPSKLAPPSHPSEFVAPSRPGENTGSPGAEAADARRPRRRAAGEPETGPEPEPVKWWI